MGNDEKLHLFSGCGSQAANEVAIFGGRFTPLRQRAVERRLGSASHRWCTFLYRSGAWMFWFICFALSQTIYREATRRLHSQILAMLPMPTEASIDPRMCAAVIVAEDHRFWMHKGVDHVAFLRASISCIKGHRQGGSTIEQQLVRVVSGDYRITLRRKIKELSLATRVSAVLGKEDLVHLYLHVAYLGSGAEGVIALAHRLGFDVNDVSFYEAAQIAACLKYPLGATETPIAVMRRARRVEYIVARFNALGITEGLSLRAERDQSQDSLAVC